jgi:hypothetical protein
MSSDRTTWRLRDVHNFGKKESRHLTIQYDICTHNTVNMGYGYYALFVIRYTDARTRDNAIANAPGQC